MPRAGSIKIAASHPERCLRAQHSGAPCAACTRFCPTLAISHCGLQLQFDRERCIGCGLCLSLCPTEAFSSDNWSERWLLNALSTEIADGEEVNLACVHAAYAGRLVRTRACVGAFSPAALASAACRVRLNVFVGACGVCPVSGGAAIVRANINTANRWLKEAGVDRTIGVRAAAGEGFSEQRLGGRETSGRACTRVGGSARALSPRRQTGDAAGVGKVLDAKKPPRVFSSERLFESSRLRNAGARTARQAGSIAATAGTTVSLDLRKALEAPHVALRERALVDWRSKISAPSVRITLPSVDCDVHHCLSCGTCYQFCPTGAIEQSVVRRTRSSTFVFLFNPGICADCGLCLIACPTHALSRTYRRSDPRDTVVVYASEGGSCKRCGLPISLQHGDECFWCRNQSNFETVVESARRNQQLA